MHVYRGVGRRWLHECVCCGVQSDVFSWRVLCVECGRNAARVFLHGGVEWHKLHDFGGRIVRSELL